MTDIIVKPDLEKYTLEVTIRSSSLLGNVVLILSYRQAARLLQELSSSVWLMQFDLNKEIKELEEKITILEQGTEED